MAAIGTMHPDRIMRNSDVKAGDVLVLSKRLGVGIFSAAWKQERLSARQYQVMLASTTQLNAVGRDLAGLEGVHAITDVTRFRLLGHAVEMGRGSDLRGWLRLDVPILEGTTELAQVGLVTGAGARNWSSYGAEVSLPAVQNWQRALLCNPQTSGGLLVAVAATDTVLHQLHQAEFARAVAIGKGAGIEVVP